MGHPRSTKTPEEVNAKDSRDAVMQAVFSTSTTSNQNEWQALGQSDLLITAM